MKINVKITTMIMLLFAICAWGGKIPGDVNCDGRLSVADFSAIAAYIMGNAPENFDEVVADANSDGTISVGDLSYIINKVMRTEDNSDVDEQFAYEDTLYVHFDNDTAIVSNPLTEGIKVFQSKADVEIKSSLHKGFVLIANGSSSDGRLRIDADTTYTLRLEGLTLTSSHAPAINSTSKQKMALELADGTVNKLQDAKKYAFNDTTETANGCFSSLGAVTFRGNGTLEVTGKAKHAIYAKKSLTFNEGTYNVATASSDAIHSGKSITVKGGIFNLDGMQGEAFDMDDDFTMSRGSITMNITGEAAKGIKCGGVMNITDGEITATATGALKNKKGELSYCTILKCDSDAVISGGDFHLVNNSEGGKCISVDHNLTIDGGTFYLETNGDGAEYINADGEKDYYTSKCLAVDDTLLIQRGNIECLSTGVGGKGIVGGELSIIGKENKNSMENLTIRIETLNTAVVNDTIADERYGCPKCIKIDGNLYIYDGDIRCFTHGVGGEGVECCSAMYIYGGNIECETFDDGINVDGKLDVFGGTIYCHSTDNDGIDSNGKTSIMGGIIASISSHLGDESFDSDRGRLFIYGGTIIGIGRDAVRISDASQYYYATHKEFMEGEYLPYTEIELHAEQMLTITDDTDNTIMSLRNPVEAENCYVIFSSPTLRETEYHMKESSAIECPEKTYFGNKLVFGGNSTGDTDIKRVEVTKENY